MEANDLSPALIQPMAAEDVAGVVANVSVSSPANGVVEIGGPEPFPLDALIRQSLTRRHDPREVITDPKARYFGAELAERSLIPGDGALLTETRFEDWVTARFAG